MPPIRLHGAGVEEVDASRTCLFGSHSENARDALSGNCSSTTIANSEGQIADQRIAGRVIATLPDLRAEAAPIGAMGPGDAIVAGAANSVDGETPTGGPPASPSGETNSRSGRLYCNNVAQGAGVERHVGSRIGN